PRVDHILVHPTSPSRIFLLFFFTNPAPTDIYTLSLHDALPISLANHLCSLTTSCASFTGSGFSATESNALNTDVFTPTPSASVRTATRVNPGDLRSMRRPKRKSCQHVSTNDSQPPERTISLLTSRLPRSKRTARRASLRLNPSFIFSSAAIS